MYKRQIKYFLVDYNNGEPITKDWLLKYLEDITGILDKKNKISDRQKVIKDAEELERKRLLEINRLNQVTTAIQTIRQNKYLSNKHESSKFQVLYDLIKEFEGKNPLQTIEVNQLFCDKFASWAESEKKYKLSTIISFIKRVRRAVVYVYENDDKNIIQVSKTLKTFALPKDKNRNKKRVVITLDYSELEKIENATLPESLENARRVILIGCETGLRFSDYNQLSVDNLVMDNFLSYWEFYSQKTDSYVRIPKTNRIDDLIKKFGLPKNDYSQHDDILLNEQIKEVCRISGIDTPITGQKQMFIDAVSYTHLTLPTICSV